VVEPPTPPAPAADDSPSLHPGDIAQVFDVQHPWHGYVAMIEEVRPWGFGLLLLAPVPGRPGSVEWRERFKRPQLLQVGVAALIPPDVAAARRDSIETARLIEEEKANG
jgi:hypothetical protein